MEEDYPYYIDFTIDEFRQCVKDKSITPYDGTGYYVVDGEEVVTAEVFRNPRPPKATHVRWYNK